MNNDSNFTPNSKWFSSGAWSGGTVTAVLLLEETPALLAASRAGIFRSVDQGATWQRSSHGLDDPSVLALAAAVDARQRSLLFAATETGRLYRSMDGAQTWQELTGWAGLGVATALSLSPNFAEDQTLFVATQDGPFRSQDGGASWESASFGLVDLEVLCFAIDPNFAGSETLWLGTANGGLYRSRNGGRSWRDAGAGLPDTAMQCLATLPRERETLLFLGTEEHGIFLSQDGGTSWLQLAALSQASVNCIAVTMDGQRLLAATDAGIFYSTDGGERWQRATDDEVIALSLVWGNDGLTLAGSWQNGLYRSQDGGRTWQRANGKAESAITAHAPPLALLTPTGELFAADLDGEWVRSTNRGATWKPVMLEFEEPVQVLASSGTAQNFVLCAGSGTTLFQRQGANDWQQIPLPEPLRHLVLSPGYAQDGVLFCAGAAGGLYRSTDHAESWQPLSIPWAEQTLLDMAVSPFYAEDNSLYTVTVTAGDAGYQMGLWQSADGGETWIDLAAFSTEIPAVSLLPIADDQRSLFLAVQNRLIHLYTKVENGEMAVDQQFLERGVRITALAASPAGTVYAASNRGVWERTENGALQPVGTGLADQIVVAVLPAEDGKICAVTLGGGVWWLGS